MKNIIIDCFAGGGGASVGIEMSTGRSVDIAINHDPGAIRMHKMNHPDTIHLTEDIFSVDLKPYVKNEHVSLMWASPACTHYSRAKGAGKLNEQLRILPWSVFKHAKDLLPDVIIMENVPEIQSWGPLNEDGRPIPERKGEDYNRFISRMKALGYDYDCRELVAADYGAPTIRKRWYAIFRRDGKDIIWPDATHSKTGENGLEKWIPAYTVLDLEDYGNSIFERNKPLVDKTLNRIAKGIEKFVCNPDLNYSSPAKVSEKEHFPKHTEVQSFLTKFYKSDVGQTVNVPLHTITTSPGHFGLVSVITCPVSELRDEDKDKCMKVSQFVMEYYGQGVGQSIKSPLHTIVTKSRFALVSVITTGEKELAILDIRLRMLTAEELMKAQGFPEDYIIDRDSSWHFLSTQEKVLRIGNSVVPVMAKVLVDANLPELKERERTPNIRTFYEHTGQLAFAQ